VKGIEDAVLETGARLFGVRRLAGLIGYSALLLAVAPKEADREWVLDHGPLSVATRYRRVRELEQLRAALIESGYDVDGSDEGAGLVPALRAVAA